MSNDLTDQSTDIRPGEELDSAKIREFLTDNIPGLSGDIIIKQFPGGMSNLTYHIIAGDKEMVLRRPPVGSKVKSAHDMGREHKFLTALRPVFPYCPKPLAYTEDTSIMGYPFYVMEKIKGIILRKDLPPGMSLDASAMRTLCEELLDVQLRLHTVDYKAVGLDVITKPEGYVTRQVEGWIRRYENSRTENTPNFDNITKLFLEKIPPDTDRPGVIHNDYRFDNVVLDPQNPLTIIGVLDWEMVTVGDPLMDLGNSLAYWIQADDPPEVLELRMAPTHLPGALTRNEMVERYVEKSGCSIENFEYYLGFGVFRLAVIIQQIYYRFTKGLTADLRFEELLDKERVLERLLNQELDKL